MTAYRRNFVAGGTYFFTIKLADRRSSLLTDNIELLRAAFRYTRRRHPFRINGRGIARLPSCVVDTTPLATAISQPAGGSSRRRSDALCALPKAFPPADRAIANAASGNGASGSTRSATRTMLLVTWITYISTRSSAAMSSACKTGRFRHSIAWCGSAVTRSNGPAAPAMSRAVALARDDGYRSAPPILHMTLGLGA